MNGLMNNWNNRVMLAAIMLSALGAGVAESQVTDTAFSYQGRLQQDGLAYTGVVDLEFTLWDAPVAGTQIGEPQELLGVVVEQGLFTVTLDFGPAAFDAAPGWLAIAVDDGAGEGWIDLTTRQPVTATPYAIQTRGMFVDDDGQVGMGTQSPNTRLEIWGDNSTKGVLALVNRTYASASDRCNVAITGYGNEIEPGSADATGRLWYIGNGTSSDRSLFVFNHSPDLLRFGTDNTTRAVIDEDGNFGIGTARPDTLLHVAGTGAFDGHHIALFESSGSEADGIAIQLDNPNTNKDNNFVTFYDGNGNVAGRIEGFDLENGDWIAPPPIPTGDFHVQFDPGQLPSADWSPGTLPSLIFSWSSGPDFSPGSLPSLTFNAGRLPSVQDLTWTLPDLEEIEALTCWALTQGVDSFVSLDPVELTAQALKAAAYRNCLDGGVVYASGGADYAEWLPRLNPDEHIQFGDIVGVYGGKISRQTEGADQILAISHKPIVLGNMPPAGDEHLYEKVGFLGQVKVVVRGQVDVGDFILASGLEDGTGVAVHPDELLPEHLDRVLGRAWSASDGSVYSFITVAIGMNTDGAREILANQQSDLTTLRQENEDLQSQLQDLAAQLQALQTTVAELGTARVTANRD